jgi:hypothetical protein
MCYAARGNPFKTMNILCLADIQQAQSQYQADRRNDNYQPLMTDKQSFNILLVMRFPKMSI